MDLLSKAFVQSSELTWDKSLPGYCRSAHLDDLLGDSFFGWVALFYFSLTTSLSLLYSLCWFSFSILQFSSLDFFSEDFNEANLTFLSSFLSL